MSLLLTVNEMPKIKYLNKCPKYFKRISVEKLEENLDLQDFLLRLIHTRCSGLRIPQWMVALPRRDRKIPILVSTQSTAESALLSISLKGSFTTGSDFKSNQQFQSMIMLENYQ